MQVALLGGSFNPPHVGHVLAAHYVRATQPVDEVWLMPTFRHPFGKAAVDYEHRLAMCERIAQDASGWLKVSTVEREVGGAGRTVDTLSYLTGRNPEHRYVLVIGSDILGDLPGWKDFDRIERMARVLVLYRGGFPSDRAVGPPLAQVSSTEVREALRAGRLPSDLVPRRVLEYVEEHRLYRGG